MARVPDANPGAYPDVNLFRALANSPQMLKGVGDLGGRLLNRSELPPATREAVILAVAGQHGCEYELHHHQRIAIEQGLTEAQVEAAVDGDVESFSPEVGAALGYAMAYCSDAVDDGAWAAAAEFYTPSQMVELTVLCGFYSMLARTIDALGVAVDE